MSYKFTEWQKPKASRSIQKRVTVTRIIIIHLSLKFSTSDSFRFHNIGAYDSYIGLALGIEMI